MLETTDKIDLKYSVNVNNGEYIFYLKDVNTLPLFVKENDSSPLLEVSLDTEMYGEYEGYTLEGMLNENGFIIEDDLIISKNDLEEIDSIPLYFENSNSIESYTTFYKFEGLLFIVNPSNSAEYFFWENAKEMIIDTINISQLWHYGNDTLKQLFFEEDLDDIVTVVDGMDDEGNNIEEDFIITESFSLREDNPAYNFKILGKTNDDKIIYYSINNYNVTQADLPRGYEVDRDVLINYLKSLKKWNKAEHEDCIFQDENYLKVELLKFGFREDAINVTGYVNEWMDENGFNQTTSMAEFEIAENYPNLNAENIDDLLSFLGECA